jgi:pyroglutamyl-peptidase
MLSLLVTGFGPFAGVPDNPSEAIARSLDGAVIEAGARAGTVTSVVLDVAWAAAQSATGEPVRAAADALRDAVERTRPDVLLSLGVMSSEPRLIKIESRAIDFRAARADAFGTLPAARRAHPTAPGELETGLPVPRIIASLTDAGFEAVASNDAGKFLCEAIAYEGALLATTAGSSIRCAGFMHVPNMRDPAPLVKAARLVLETCIALLPGE